jgi:hypothetical protein
VDVVYLIAFIVLAALGFAYATTRPNTLIEQWADQHGYVLISSEQQLSPLLLQRNRRFSVYNVRIRTPEHVERSACLLCNRLTGALTVDWEGTPLP